MKNTSNLIHTKTDRANFALETKDVKKIMVLDLGFLGDTIHLLPALWVIHQNYPQAELHIAVSNQVSSLFKSIPWVKKAWSYVRYPRHASVKENIRFILEMRREKFDLLINLNGSDRSCFLSYFIHAKYSVGRVSENTRPFRNYLFYKTIYYPTKNKPAYMQRCEMLKEMGLKFQKLEFNIEVTHDDFKTTGLLHQDKYQYIHMSPFTSSDTKELSFKQINELMLALSRKYPNKKIIFSCAPNQRETEKMKKLIAFLEVKPWKVFAGSLDLTSLVSLIKHASLHLSGDTGTVHIARMMHIPTVAWFRDPGNSKAWIPDHKKSNVLILKKASENMDQVHIKDVIKKIDTLLK